MVKVCTSFPGAGKTSAAINYMNMHPEHSFLYVTLYASESDRIMKACPKMNFAHPNSTASTHAIKDLEELLKSNTNIAITSSLFRNLDTSMVELISRQGYTIIIDEDNDVFLPLQVSHDDIKLAIASGWLDVQDDEYGTTYTFTDNEQHSYHKGRLHDLFSYLKSQKLTKLKQSNRNVLWFWPLNQKIFAESNDVIFLSSFFQGSVSEAFLRYLDVPYEYIYVANPGIDATFSSVPQLPPSYVAHLSELITIVDNTKMNKAGDPAYTLSHNWYKKKIGENSAKSMEELAVLRRHTRNFFRNIVKDVPLNNRMWTTYKIGREYIKGNGFASTFQPLNLCGCNDLHNCTALAYIANIYKLPTVRLQLKACGATINDNDYALSTMIQWIWRSAIRDGKPIHIYLPSRRMRTLLKNWIKESEETYHRMKSAEAE